MSKSFKLSQTGHGPAIILIGGNQNEWGEAIELLSQNFTLIIPSFSEKIISKQAEKDLVSYLDLVVSELQLERFSILAHSVGAYTGILYSVQNPGKVSSLIISSLPDLSPGDFGKFEKLFGELSGRNQKKRPRNLDYWYPLLNNQLNTLNSNLREATVSFKTLLVSGEHDTLSNPNRSDNWKWHLSPDADVEIFRYAGHFPIKDNPLYFSLLVKNFLKRGI